MVAGMPIIKTPIFAPRIVKFRSEFDSLTSNNSGAPNTAREIMTEKEITVQRVDTRANEFELVDCAIRNINARLLALETI
jgi:hypothetical protein